MLIRPSLQLAVLLAVAASPFPLFGQQDLAGRIAEIDAVRSSDPQAFVIALEQLEQSMAGASLKDRQHIELLRAYREGFSGRVDESIRIAEGLHSSAVDPRIRLRASLLIANTSAATRGFASGLEHLGAALSILETETLGVEEQSNVLAVATLLYNQLEKPELGLQYADRLLALDIDDRTRCIGMQQRLSALQALGRWSREREEFDAALHLCQEIGEQVFAGFLHLDAARQLVSDGRPAAAEALLESELERARSAGYPRLISEFHSMLAASRLQAGELEAARGHARAAIDVDAASSASLPRVQAWWVLYEAASQSGDTAAALDYHRRYAEADKAYLDDVMVRELAFQQSRNEVRQKDQAIELLSKQNEVLTLEQEVARKSEQNTRLALALLTVVLAAIVLWIYKIKRLQGRLRSQAQTDDLTRISNRRHFRERAEALLRECTSSGRDAALVLFDLDHFKDVNDHHGHATGDWLLVEVAKVCRRVCGDGDVCGRLGGEEFGLLSCGGDVHAARRIAERLQQGLAAIDGSAIGYRDVVTASFGCTSVSRSGPKFERLFSDADAAMYRGKREGRDRVELHPGGAAGMAAAPG
ncbi:diguanylate cyclase [Lysobacter sp. SG-8]|uniref:diguanylate cyclase n=1 Tax=Marilutibacter penaei TaxID=2759900 RepID=A0A7W3U4F0_9GAMM|nr:GGDEF domain-containing protein [Lysobacter penaei]MBB1088767.1 diguanylate cyclase [Lysobacter penaei]